MSFILPQYHAPDFTFEHFLKSPDVITHKALRDGVAPKGFHSTSMFPEYYKVGGQWLLAEESRMDCLVILDEEGGSSRLSKGAASRLGTRW